MTNDVLLRVLMDQAGEVIGPEGNWQFTVHGIQCMCLTDAQANRMRVMAPIGQADGLEQEILMIMLEANFHSALDARLAVFENVVWSLYVSPLAELTPELLRNAIEHVTTLTKNTQQGNFASGPWQFGGAG